MPATRAEAVETQPDDWARLADSRLPDGGPPYTETPVDLGPLGAPFPAEPWNTVTATIFIWVAAAWLWRLRGRHRAYPFVTCCMPILLAGGIGGTLFHGTRASRAFFLLDVIPISALGLAGSMFMAIRFWGPRGWFFLPGVAVFYLVVNVLVYAVVAPTDIQWRVNLSYASLAVVVLLPILLVLIRTKFRHAGWVACGVISFAIAWLFRLIDRDLGARLPMGTHWLWHTFGAITTAVVIQYFYLVEGEKTLDQVGAEAAQPDGPGGQGQ